MAAPHVAGVAALLLAKNPTWTATQVKDRILDTVTPATSLAGKTVTGGILNAAAALQSTMTFVDLSAAANAQVFTHDNQTFPTSVGVESGVTPSRALSYTQLTGTVPWPNVTTFTLGAVGVNHATSGTRTVTLPAGKYAKLHFLATAGWGSYADRTYRVNYTDSTFTEATQSFSSWTASSTFPGETLVKTTDHRNVSDGTRINSPTRVYGYTLTLDSSKQVASFVTPNHGKVFVLAAMLESSAQPAEQRVTLPFNRMGFSTDGQTFSGSAGIDTSGRALSSNLLTASPITFHGAGFYLGTPMVNNVAAGQVTITPTPGKYQKLYFLATSAWGNYVNQQFTINYATGAPYTPQLSFSNWTAPQSYTGEEVVLTMNYRNLSTGVKDFTTVYLYGYTITLDPSREVTSIVTASQGKINILAMTLVA